MTARPQGSEIRCSKLELGPPPTRVRAACLLLVRRFRGHTMDVLHDHELL